MVYKCVYQNGPRWNRAWLTGVVVSVELLTGLLCRFSFIRNHVFTELADLSEECFYNDQCNNSHLSSSIAVHVALVGLSFSGAIGLTFLLLGCALEQYGYVDLCAAHPVSIFPVPKMNRTCKCNGGFFLLQGVLASLRPVLLRAVSHPHLHSQKNDRWLRCCQQCMQRAGILLYHWDCGLCIWDAPCTGPKKRSEL